MEDMNNPIGHGSLRHARMVEKYGQEVADRIYYEFSKVEGDYEFVDTWRVCDAYDSADMKQYKEIKEGGCCGSVDFQVVHKGNVYWFGFNYGH